MAELVLTRSTAPLRRHAERKPVTIPATIARKVPMNTIGIVFFSLSVRVETTGWESVNDTPMFAWKRSSLR